MKARGIKRTLSLLLTALLLISTAVFTVSADGVTVKVDGVPYVAGEKICAVSTVELTLPAPVADLTAVNFSELSKEDDTVWHGRNFDGVLNADKNVLTVTFTRGDISSNSTYKFEFDTTPEAAETPVVYEYSFDFSTKMEAGVYFAENFSRFKSNASNDLDMGGFAAAGTAPHNLNPLAKMRGWVGGGYTKVTTYDSAPAFKIYGNGNNFINLGVIPRYSAPLPGLNHLGETTVEFQLANVQKWADFAGVTVTSADGLTLDVYVEATAKALNGDNNFAAGNPVKLGSKTYSTTTEAGGWHKIQIATDTTFTANGTGYTKKLLKVTLDGTVVWRAGATGPITMPSANHNAAGGGGITGFTKAVPALPSNVTQVEYAQMWATAGSTNLYVRYAEYKDYIPEVSLSVENDPQVGIYDPVTVQLDTTPVAAEGSADAMTTTAFVNAMTNSGNISWSYDADAISTNVIELTPAAPYAHNTQYTVTVPTQYYANNITGSGAELTFTTGWEKLAAELSGTPAISSAAGADSTTYTLDLSAADALAVENITSSLVNYKTVLALYKKDGTTMTQVAATVTPQTALAAGDDTTISAGTVSYVDTTQSATAEYFAKLFLISGAAADAIPGADALTEPFVFGTATAEDASAAATDTTSYIAYEADADRGRLDVTGQSVGSLADRALFVTVSDNVGVVYYDQLSSGEDGKFAFGCNITPDVSSSPINESYTINVKPSDKAAITQAATIGFNNVKPYISSITVSGTPQYKETLTASYVLEDFFERTDDNNATVVEWWTASEADGTYALAHTGTSFTVPAEETGKYVKCIVTPKVSGGAVVGSPYDSLEDDGDAALYLKSIPEITAASLSQAESSNNILLNYSISDPLNHELGVHTITWTFKNASGDTVKTISGEPVTTLYTASESDDGLKVTVTVTPRVVLESCNAGEECVDVEYGAPMTTSELTIDYYSSGGGGGGGAIRVVKGEGNPVEEISAPAYQSPDATTAEGATDFTDVRGHWAEAEIFSLYDQGIVTGRTEHTFDPDGQITRAEFMAILVRAMGLETVAFAGDFADVAYNSWYADILATAKHNGLLQGFGGYANPDQPITREEMVQIIVRAYEAACGEIKVGGGLLDYADASAISDWAQLAVIKATEISLVNGTGDGCFSPLANTTRAQSAVLIVRLMPHLEQAAEDKAAAEAKAAEEAAKAAEEAEKAEQDAAMPEETTEEVSEETTEETTEEPAADTEAVAEEDTTDVGAEDAPAAE